MLSNGSRWWPILLAAVLAAPVADTQDVVEPDPPAADAAPERAAETAGEAPGENAVAGPVLDPVIVTATRSEQDPFDVPYTVAPIDGRTAATEKGARTLPEALREIPGVMVQKTSTGQGSPFIRGLHGVPYALPHRRHSGSTTPSSGRVPTSTGTRSTSSRSSASRW